LINEAIFEESSLNTTFYVFTISVEVPTVRGMDKHTLRWVIPVALLAVLASQFAARADWRAMLSRDYWQSLSRYGMVLRIVESEFVHADEVDFRELTDVALRSAVSSLDPYSNYMTADDYEEFSMASNQEYVGVGIEVRQFSGRIIISQVFEQGSAAGGGILAGDFIIGVDGVDTREESLGEVIDRIRGEPGSQVALEIERPITAEEHIFALERRAIALDSVVDVEMTSATVGYMRVRQFIDETDLEMVSAIHALNAQGMQSLILDLRGNPGGRLDIAVKMAEVFLQEGQKILTVQSRRGVEDVFYAKATVDQFQQPLLVLIDGHSASASEILSGALRDHDRAFLVGVKSYGKGSVQSVYSFPNGDGLKLTSARYLLPNGEAINGTGVCPDVTVERSTEEAVLLMLQAHHLRHMSAEAFTKAFGFAPVADTQRLVAQQMLDALIGVNSLSVDRGTSNIQR
jgi:carboxyl-terminal processing protease